MEVYINANVYLLKDTIKLPKTWKYLVILQKYMVH